MVLDIDDRGVLQVLLGADSGLDAVRMAGKQHGINGFHSLGVILRKAHVLLLIDSLQLGVEAADHRVDEPVSLDLRPILYLVGGNILLIDSHVGGREGVGSGRSDDGHQFIIFIGDGDLRGLIADRVDHMVEGDPLLRICLGPIFLEKAPDLVEHRLLRLIVRGSETLRTLEHQVLQIVGQARCLVRIILAADPHGYVSLQPGGLLIDSHIHLQTIVQGVDLRVHGIAFHGLVLVLRA